MIKLKDIETGKIHQWTIEQVIHEINRDRGDTWVNYDMSDWLDGWDSWCEGDYYTIVKQGEEA